MLLFAFSQPFFCTYAWWMDSRQARLASLIVEMKSETGFVFSKGHAAKDVEEASPAKHPMAKFPAEADVTVILTKAIFVFRVVSQV